MEVRPADRSPDGILQEAVRGVHRAGRRIHGVRPPRRAQGDGSGGVQIFFSSCRCCTGGVKLRLKTSPALKARSRVFSGNILPIVSFSRPFVPTAGEASPTFCGQVIDLPRERHRLGHCTARPPTQALIHRNGPLRSIPWIPRIHSHFLPLNQKG